MINGNRTFIRCGDSDRRNPIAHRAVVAESNKEDLVKKIKSWIRGVAPRTELRQWFNPDPVKWDEFRRCYCAEPKANPDGWQPIIDTARDWTVTLIYSSHDTGHNNAVALEELLIAHLPKKKSGNIRPAQARATLKAQSGRVKV